MSRLVTATVPVTPLRQNCTLVWDDQSRQAVVIDPGGDAEQIVAALAKHRLDVEAIWLTHGHLDHAGGAAELRDRLGSTVPIIGPHRADEFLLTKITEEAAELDFRGMRSVSPDQWLAEGDMLQVGTHRFDVLHCPGHTPGHVIFVDKVARFAQVGDVLFAGSIGRTDLAYGDRSALLADIVGKVLPLGDDVAFICGHGPGSTIGRERLTNRFLC